MIYRDYKIHLKHRTRLILINGTEGFPGDFGKIVKVYQKRDRYQEIEFYSLKKDVIPINL